jgi:membrane fusion protein (multidrug efflux system)
MFMTVRLVRSEGEALVVPEQAIVPENDRHFVYVVADGRAERREVALGRRRPGEVEIVAGLTTEDDVIIEGALNVRDGSPVRIRASAGEGAGPT